MHLEELREFRNQARAEANGEKKDEKERQGRSRRGDSRRDNRGPRLSWYTPLGKILKETLSTELILPPRRALSSDNVDPSKKCRYHKNTGHSNEECQALKDKIVELIQIRHLRCFVQGSRTTKRSPCREEASRKRDRTLPGPKDDDRRREQRGRRGNPPKDDRGRGREVINTIAEGFAGGGSSNSARRKHLRVVHQVNFVAIWPRMPPITFTNDDFKGVDPS